MEKKLIKMHLGVRIATIFTCLLFSVGNIFAQTDPCSQKTKLSGGTTINNQNKTGNTNTGYQYKNVKLIDFENILIIVSHNRHFLNRVCTHICDVDFGT